MHINFITFGLKYGHDHQFDFQIDTRILPNPFYVQELKDKSGLDDEVYDYVINSIDGQVFCQRLTGFLDYYFDKISFHDSINVGICCTGGQHRSVAVARFLSEYYKEKYEISLIHHEQKSWE